MLVWTEKIIDRTVKELAKNIEMVCEEKAEKLGLFEIENIILDSVEKTSWDIFMSMSLLEKSKIQGSTTVEKVFNITEFLLELFDVDRFLKIFMKVYMEMTSNLYLDYELESNPFSDLEE